MPFNRLFLGQFLQIRQVTVLFILAFSFIISLSDNLVFFPLLRTQWPPTTTSSASRIRVPSVLTMSPFRLAVPMLCAICVEPMQPCTFWEWHDVRCLQPLNTALSPQHRHTLNGFINHSLACACAWRNLRTNSRNTHRTSRKGWDIAWAAEDLHRVFVVMQQSSFLRKMCLCEISMGSILFQFVTLLVFVGRVTPRWLTPKQFDGKYCPNILSNSEGTVRHCHLSIRVSYGLNSRKLEHFLFLRVLFHSVDEHERHVYVCLQICCTSQARVRQCVAHISRI